MRASGASWRTIAKELSVGIGTVRRAAQSRAKNVCGASFDSGPGGCTSKRPRRFAGDRRISSPADWRSLAAEKGFCRGPRPACGLERSPLFPDRLRCWFLSAPHDWQARSAADRFSTRPNASA